MTYSRGNIPLYFQFYLQLKQSIIIGEHPPGSVLPNLDELNKQTGISHGMIRKAMALLEKEGLIVRKQRIGTVIKKNVNRSLWQPVSSRQDIQERYLNEKVILLSAGWVDAPNHVRVVFSNDDNALRKNQIYMLHFLLISKVEEQRRSLSTLYVPAWRYKETSKAKLSKSPLQTVIDNLNLVNIKQIIRPWFCDHEASKYLEIPEGIPIFHRTLIAFLDDGRPLGVLEQLTNVYALERDMDIR